MDEQTDRCPICNKLCNLMEIESVEVGLMVNSDLVSAIWGDGCPSCCRQIRAAARRFMNMQKIRMRLQCVGLRSGRPPSQAKSDPYKNSAAKLRAAGLPRPEVLAAQPAS